MICKNCKHSLEDNALFCSDCGVKVPQLEDTKSAYVSKYAIDFKDTAEVGTQIRALFFKELEAVVEEEFGPNEFRKYFDQFYKSEFYKDFDLRTQQLSEEVVFMNLERDQNTVQEIDQLLAQNFHAFIDLFIVMYCKDLHKMALPESLLKYANADLETVDLRQMILDYLDFENEQDKVYTDLFKISQHKIKNAVKAFLFAQPQETIFFICDQTIFGSCQEGFVMTDHALYWKSHFNPPQSIAYKDLVEIKKEAEWLSINGLFFNVNKHMNFKMMKLLKKFRGIPNS